MTVPSTPTGLRRHIPELAIEWALDEPGRLWQAIDGTLCFADISGFTALSEKLSRRGRIGGEELVETLSRVFGGMLDSARERDGMLLKFGGDALLFLFKGPDHALRAAATAVEMRQALRKAKEIPTSVGPLNLSMSVGLHSGLVHFFLVGSPHRELVLAGPDATLAAATENAANAGEIGVSTATAERLPASAVRDRGDGLLLLRWRKPPSPPAGASPERPASDLTLRRLFPRALGEVLTRGRPDPEHRVACIAFVRFSGTDRMLEQDGPDAVAMALQATLEAAMEIFEDEAITLMAVDIDKDGGKLFLGAGVPQAAEDDEDRMIRALRKLVTAGTPLPLQAGINRGHVFAAEVGTTRRAAYSAMGDTTNTAARICAKTPPGEVYVHPSVLAHARIQYATEQAGPFTFKGKKVPQVLYRIGEATGVAPIGDGEQGPTVGRRQERAALGQAVDALASGEGGVVSLTGPAGIGKSHLLRDTLKRLGGIPALKLRADPYGMNSPYRAFQDGLRAWLGIEADSPAAMRERLRERVSQVAPDLLPYLAFIGDVARIDVEPSPEVAAIEPRFRPDRIADTIIRLLEAGREGARVIVAEDAHWCDGASAHLVKRLAEACAQRPWLMLAAYRDEDSAVRLEQGTTLALGPMPDADIAELVNEATVSTPLRPHELDLVVLRAGGNPLHANEIIRAARAAGSFEAVPDSLEAAIAAQVDALDPEARQLLRHATVLGRRFRRSDLDELLKAEGLTMDDGALSRLESFLVPDGESGMRFREGLLRKTIYEGLAYRLRVRLHREAGESMERMAEDPEGIADSLAMHFSIAGDHERTWRYGRHAAERAKRAYANVDAARLYRTALDAARHVASVPTDERITAWIALGDVRRAAGLFDDALEAYRQAARLATDDPVTRARTHLLRANAHERKSRFATALRELSRGRKLLDGLKSPGADKCRLDIDVRAATIRLAQDRFADALRQAERAIQDARALGDRQALADALMAADSAELCLGRPAKTRMLEALALYQELGDLSNEARLRCNLGYGAYLEGDWNTALEWFEGYRSASIQSGNSLDAAIAASNIGEMLVRRGALEEAYPLLNDAVRVMRATGFSDGAAWAEIQIGRLLIARGAHDKADALLERVRSELRKLGKSASALEAACVQAQAKSLLGQGADALMLLDESISAAGQHAATFAPQIAESRVRALAAMGRRPEARLETDAGIEAARAAGLQYEEAALLAARIELDRGQGKGPDVRDVAALEKILANLGIESMPRLAA